jgi:hypothetical protein
MSPQSQGIAALEKKIEAIHDVLLRFSTWRQETRLIGALFRPCSPSVAEYALISNALDNLLDQAQAVSRNYSALTEAVEAVCGKGATVTATSTRAWSTSLPVTYSHRSMRVKVTIPRPRLRSSQASLQQRKTKDSRARVLRLVNDSVRLID